VGLAKGLQVVGEFVVRLAEELQVGPAKEFQVGPGEEFQVGPVEGDFAEQNPSVLTADISDDG